MAPELELADAVDARLHRAVGARLALRPMRRRSVIVGTPTIRAAASMLLQDPVDGVEPPVLLIHLVAGQAPGGPRPKERRVEAPTQPPASMAPYADFIRETLERYPKICSTRVWDMLREGGVAGSARALVATVSPKSAGPLRLTGQSRS